MRRFGLLLVILPGMLAFPAVSEAGCGKHGTQVEFVDTPKEAADKAKKEEKLVFVLHLSGVFEDPKLT
ncbi:MAG TPA: hypothetical protein VKA46_11165 [Gemmataceae bacterium]|nr:hypothetical protein [Gemmataceae bacterium]